MRQLWTVVSLLALFSLVNSKCLRPSLLVVSFDGFRHDYFDKNASPNMLRLRETGTYAEHMKNVFPTKTFPNHHSIATGLYPEVHGVLSKEVYDPQLGRVLTFEEMWHYNKDVVPIWTLNQAADDGCHTGTSMWPGSSETYRDTPTTFHADWDKTATWTERADVFVSWFRHPATPANLVVAYFEEPDYLAHKYGPDSEQVLAQIRRVDNITQYIFDRLVHLNLTDVVNVVLVSDHGMDAVNKSKIVDIGQNIDNATYVAVGSSPIYQVWPRKTDDKKAVDTLYEVLQEEAKASRHFSVYRREEIPEEWHYRDNARSPPLLVLGEEGYGFQDLLLYNISGYTVDNMTWGVHGYSNGNSKMWPFFMAWGPRIRSGHRIAPFDTVDLFSLFAEVLELGETQTNGTFAHVKDMLVGREEPMTWQAVVGITLLVLLIIVGGLVIAFFTRRADLKRPRRNTMNDSDPLRRKPEDNPLLDENAELPTEVV